MSSTLSLPAEWAPQAGVMLTWPHHHSDWQDTLAEAEQCYIELTGQIARYQNVIISCFDDSHRQHVLHLLEQNGLSSERIRLYIAPSNDTWARDHGPITVLRDGQLVLLNFRFNGWGGKYPCQLDDQITPTLYRLGAFGDLPLDDIDLILEGGSIDTDGQGTLLTTRACLLDPNRNRCSEAEIERHLGLLFGVDRFLWLSNGHLEGDDTDSHIDTLARFSDAETIVYQSCDRPDDPHYPALQARAAELAGFRTRQGQSYRLLPLPFPAPKHDDHGNRLPASYANFLIINGAVLVPIYADSADDDALAVIQTAFPDHEVVGVDCRALIRQFGSLHCITMQLPC